MDSLELHTVAECLMKSMDPYKRIEELQAQVKHLSDLVESLAANQARDAVQPAKAEDVIAPPVVESGGVTHLVEEVIEDVERALDGEGPEILEAEVGTVWLSRLAAVAFLTAIVVGAVETFNTEMLGPWQKVGVGYAFAMAALVYGWFFGSRRDFFSETVLGSGLATLYYVTYALFFVRQMQIFPYHGAAWAALPAGLALVMGLAHRRRSRAATGIALFLIYYTVVLSCAYGKTPQDYVYALAASALLAVAVVFFHIAHRWMTLTWIAVAATYATYTYFFLSKPPELLMSDPAYFWLSNGFLALCYVVFSLACIVDARRTGEYRRHVAPLAGANSAVFTILGWMAVRYYYPDQQWMFRLAFTVLLLSFAGLAHVVGARRNYLCQMFLAKAIILLTMTIEAAFTGEQRLIALAVECLALALAYGRSNLAVFNVANALLTIFTFTGCLFSAKMPGTLAFREYVVPANWAACAGVSIVFMMIAAVYQHFAGRKPLAHAEEFGLALFGGSRFNFLPSSMALFHASAAALILVTISILDRADDPALPYWLAAESAAVALLGLLLFTPQLEVASVLLLAASHVCFHFFLGIGKIQLPGHGTYIFLTSFVATYTFLGAYLWERYLKRVPEGPAWEHHLAASIPYLAATLMLARLLGLALLGMYAPLTQNALGVVLLLLGCLVRYPSVKASGVLAFALGTHGFASNLPDFEGPFPRIIPLALLFLLTYAAAERLLIIMERREKVPTKADDVVRSVLVSVAGMLGIALVWVHAPDELLTVCWLALAVGGITLGMLGQEIRYRWAALAIFLAAAFRAFQYDLTMLPHYYRFLSFAALSAVLLAVSRIYSRARAKARHRRRSDTSGKPAFHG
ncbi:MAG: DUF2339 domain-containing protein [Candidatus Hydrogenedentes bacterium]|nr:DUF2339 domain-containing protein [Candidatus Hydrogenedentota bacterium]